MASHAVLLEKPDYHIIFFPFQIPFITFYFTHPQSYRVTNQLPYHDKTLLLLVLRQKNQAEALVKKSTCCFTPVCCLPDSKCRNSRLGRTKGKYWNSVRNKIPVPKKQELPSLSSFSLCTAHDPKPTFICGTSPANCRLQGHLQMQCMFDSSFITQNGQKDIMSW